MDGIKWEKWASVTVTLIGGALGAYLGVRYLLPLVLPFAVAFGLSVLIRPLAARFSARTHIPQKLCAVLLLLLTIGGILLLLGLLCERLVLELGHLFERLLGEGGSISESVQSSVDFFGTITSKIGFLRRIEAGTRFSALRDGFNDMMTDLLSGALSSLSGEIPRLAGRMIAALPTVLLVTLITVIAGFYFCIDGDRIFSASASLLPARWRAHLPMLRARVRRISWKYLRAYLLLWCLTVVELLVGFAILRVDYALLLALLIAFVDLLPVFGVGTVMIPWAIVVFIQGNYGLGLGLVILYGVVLILRQIIEPHLLGQSLGLHPLLTLFATYAGWQLLGVWGMLLAPFVALLCKAVVGQIQK